MAAASISNHLAGIGYHITLVTSDGTCLAGSTAELMTELATVRAGYTHELVSMAGTKLDGPAMLIAITGTLTDSDCAQLHNIRSTWLTHHRHGSGIALTLDVESWNSHSHSQSSYALPSPSAISATDMLTTQGWRTATAHRGDHLSEVWRRLA